MATEAEITKLAEEVGEVDVKDPVVKAFLLASLKSNEDEEKRLQATFRIQRLLRNDEQMKKTAEQLKSVRDLNKVIVDMLIGDAAQ